MRFADRSLHLAVLALVLIGLGAFAIAWTMSPGDREPSASRPGLSSPAFATIGPQQTPPIEVGRPLRLLIPSIGVNAPIEEVGTTGDGSQDVPRSIADTGWWRDGARPGGSGNAVIVGHTAHAADGVFDDLGKVSRGATLTVRSQHGTLRYRVTRVQDVKVADFSTISRAVYRTSGSPGLVLMTCGDWNGRRFETTTILFSTLMRS